MIIKINAIKAIFIAYIFNWNTSNNESIASSKLNKRVSLVEIFFKANGRFFVLNTFISISLSRKSLTAHPNDLVRTTPEINIINILKSGTPLLESHKAQKVGHKSKKIPMGLFSLMRLINDIILFI